jgi:transposase
MSYAVLTTPEAAAILGVSERHARRVFQSEVQTTPAGRQRIGNVADLPPDAQAHWAQMDKVVPMTPRASGAQMALSLNVPVGPNLSDSDRIEAERRYRAIEPLIARDRFLSVWAQHHDSKVEVIDFLAKAHKTARRTIYGWLTSWKQGGLPALVPKDRSDKGIPKALNTAALEFILACAFPKHGAYGKLTVRDIFRAYADERAWRAKHIGIQLTTDFDRAKYRRYMTTDGYLTDAAQLPEASYSTFKNWFNRIPEIAKVMARDGDEAFHNSQEIISFREISAVQPLEYIVMDHRRLDIFCLIRDGKQGWKLARPWLTAAIDMRTRKWLAWAVVETPSSDSIATVLKRSFLEHGLPVACYWDNGKDFRCEWLEGGSTHSKQSTVGELEPTFRGVLDTLGIRVHHAIVKRARAKLIEPNFGRTADFDRTLPWWCGHNPQARPTERFDKLLHQHERWLAGAEVPPAFPTIEQVADFYSKALNDLNERPLEGEGMNKVTPTGRGWMCPNEAWEILIRNVDRREVPAEVLQLCFAKRRPLTIRNGEVMTNWGGQPRHYRMPDNAMRLMAFNGCEVQFAYDPLDLQTAALYFDGRFIGLVECIELRRMGEDSFVEDERNRRAARRDTKAFIAAVHEQVYVPDYETNHARRAVTPRTEPARRLVAAVVPAAVAEAAAAVNKDREVPEPIAVDVIQPEPPAVDEAFNFFS